MKKSGLLTTLLVAGLLLVGCNKSVNVETEQERTFACGNAVGKYFEISDYSINWDREEEAGASYVLNGRVNIGNGLDESKITKNVECVVDMVDKSVTILEVNESEIIDDCVTADGEEACAVDIDEPEVTDIEEGNALILVFSPTGNTKRMAGYISELTDIELTEIIPVVPYTEDDLNWRNEESRTFKEFKDNTIRPEIETQINIDGYDTIYLGFPIWFGITPNLILTLLENYDFSGKNIVLFCTSEHVGIEKAVEYLEPYNLNVIASHRFAQDTTKEQVQEWLESL